MLSSRIQRSLLCLILLLVPVSARAAEPFRFPESEHGKGKLKYTDQGLPLLVVEGTPEEIGEQVAALAVKPGAARSSVIPKTSSSVSTPAPLSAAGQGLAPACSTQFPADHRKELEAMVEGRRRSRDN